MYVAELGKMSKMIEQNNFQLKGLVFHLLQATYYLKIFKSIFKILFMENELSSRGEALIFRKYK